MAVGKRGKFSEALKHFSRAIELDPENRQAYFLRAIVFEFLGDRKRSGEDFTRALGLPEKEEKTRSIRGRVSAAHVKEMLSAR